MNGRSNQQRLRPRWEGGSVQRAVPRLLVQYDPPAPRPEPRPDRRAVRKFDWPAIVEDKLSGMTWDQVATKHGYLRGGAAMRSAAATNRHCLALPLAKYNALDLGGIPADHQPRRRGQ